MSGHLCFRWRFEVPKMGFLKIAKSLVDGEEDMGGEGDKASVVEVEDVKRGGILRDVVSKADRERQSLNSNLWAARGVRCCQYPFRKPPGLAITPKVLCQCSRRR